MHAAVLGHKRLEAGDLSNLPKAQLLHNYLQRHGIDNQRGRAWHAM